MIKKAPNRIEAMPAEIPADKLLRLVRQLPDGRFERTEFALELPAGVRVLDVGMKRQRRKPRGDTTGAIVTPHMERVGAILDEIERREKAQEPTTEPVAEKVWADLPKPIEPDIVEPVRDADAEALAKLRAWKR